MVSMPRLFRATFAVAALAAGGAQAAEWRSLPEGSYQVAQATDPRVYQLEEELRTLNGKVEELSFQLLQLQEQLRKAQEDNEFRFQQLEGGGQTGSGDQRGDAGDMASPQPTQAAELPAAAPAAPAGDTATADATGSRVLGAAPRDLGTLRIDDRGQVVDGTVDFSPNKIGSAIDGDAVAAVPAPDDPEAYYRSGYESVLNGDYAVAEGVFRSFAELYPNDPLMPDARFWLAESVRAQGRLQESVDMFIALRTSYPEMQKAPETLLKIGQIMYELGDRDVACVTYKDAVARYPNMSDAVRTRLRAERAKAQC